MREQRIGQATFLPLDTLTTPTIGEHLRSLGSGIRLLIDVIQYPFYINDTIHSIYPLLSNLTHIIHMNQHWSAQCSMFAVTILFATRSI
jgi:hypothetical protein